MKKFLLLTFLPLILAFPSSSSASSATSVVETQVEGEAEVYQRVETTVNGQTVIKESSQPGKLEVKMEKTGEGEPTVTFSQKPMATPVSTLSPSPTQTPTVEQTTSFISQVVEFVQNFFASLARLAGLDIQG